MSRMVRDRIRRRLSAAEGYLELGLPEKTLEILRERPDWATMRFEANFLAGEALRLLGRHREALKPLEVAAGLKPGDASVAIALGWCYKRTHRLAQAIDVLERATRAGSPEPLLHYNLACYWSLAGTLAKALEELTLALKLEPSLRDLISDETDFDNLRADAGFRRLVEPSA